MTTATVLFDPFSEDFFKNPYEIYRRMREEAPVYYSAEYDFYALTRHEDVAAGFKDYETYSSAYGVDLAQVRKGEVTEHGSIIAMDPPGAPADARAAQQGVHPTRDPGAATTGGAAGGQAPVGRGSGRFRLRTGLLGTVPRRRDDQPAGRAGEDRQQIRLWIDDLLHRDAGQVEMSETGLKSAIDMAIYYFRLTKQRRENPGDDLLSRLIRPRSNATTARWHR